VTLSTDEGTGGWQRKHEREAKAFWGGQAPKRESETLDRCLAREDVAYMLPTSPGERWAERCYPVLLGTEEQGKLTRGLHLAPLRRPCRSVFEAGPLKATPSRRGQRAT